MAEKQVLLEVKRLRKFFPIYSKAVFEKHIGDVKAVNDVSFSVQRGETLGLVGESGCGKTTTARTAIRALAPTSGAVIFHSQATGPLDLCKLTRSQLIPLRREIQMIFQDPFSSLNPRMTIGDIVAEPLIVHNLYSKKERKERVTEILDKVGIDPDYMERYPHAFSGGQRQRVGIARALILNPQLVICDEAVSALDVSVQAQVINLLKKMQKEMGLTYVFIAHDLGVIKHICNKVAVMYAGKIVEYGAVDDVFFKPQHPYTKSLIKAIPNLDPDVKMESLLTGEVSDVANLPPGCSFHPRCPNRFTPCDREVPELLDIGDRQAACHLFNR